MTVQITKEVTNTVLGQFQSLLHSTLFSKVFVVALGFLEKVHKTNKTSGSKVVTIPKSINQLKGIALQNSQKVELDSKT